MKLKTYRAQSMAQALSAVKKDLGKDAVILHTRSVKVAGWLGFGKQTLIEITAADEPMPAAKRSTPARLAPEIVPASKPAPAAPILAATAAASAYRKAAGLGGPAPSRPGAEL